MNIDQFLQPPYTIPAKYFLQFFKSGQIERSLSEIRYSFNLCLQLCTPEFIHFLIENGQNSIFCTIAYSLHSRKMTINTLINPDDFLLACTYCDAYVIAIISQHNLVKITPIQRSNKDKSALLKILDRNDPQLLLTCFQLIPEFKEAEMYHADCLYYILQHEYTNLIDEMWILIKTLKIQKNDLLEISRNWKKYTKKPLIPILEEMLIESFYKYASIIESYRYRESKEIPKYLIEPTELIDIKCINFRGKLIEADKLRRFLMERKSKVEKNDAYEMYSIFDPKSPSLLFSLPYELMKDVKFFLNCNLYLKRSLIGHEAVGEGPVQDLFNAYFGQIMSDNPYFNSNDYSISILPTYKENDVEKTRGVFYGLGVVFLKILIDMRFIGNFQEKNSKSNKGSLHPWIFQALLQKMETDPKKLFYQALLYDRLYFNPLFEERKKGINYLISAIKENMMYLNSRGVYYQALHDGFYLNYIQGLSPSEFKDNLAFIKNELKGFYSFIDKVSPETIHFLLVGSSFINVEYLLSFFEFVPWEYFDSSGEGSDKGILFVGNDFNKEKTFRKSIEYFKQTMIDWCKEEYQEKIRDFLRYLNDVPTLSPLNREKWEIDFDFSIEKNSILYSWSCNKNLRAPLFDSVDNCKEIILKTIENYKKDTRKIDILDINKLE